MFKAAVVTSGILGVLSFAWSIFSLTNQLDSQLEASQTVQMPLHTAENEMKTALAEVVSATTPAERAPAIEKVRLIAKEFERVLGLLQAKQAHVSEEIEIYAAQRALSSHLWMSCPFCSQKWGAGSDMFSRLAEARKFKKKWQAGKFSSRCKRCAQERVK